jgi:serine/threonine protein kinase/predicted Zn-dependent protease
MTASTSLSHLLRADQRSRWQRGEAVRVESYLERHPSLHSDPEGLLDLIYNEIVLREESGDTPQIEEYLDRFASFGEQLGRLFEVHRALSKDWGSREGPVDDKDASPYDQPTDPAPPSRPPVVPGYEVLGELGRGGMGVVYKARQIALDRVVALKMLGTGPQTAPRALARFETEARLVARLHHPNIVQVYEVGTCDGWPFFSMEFVAGDSLARHLAGSPQSPRDAARTASLLARAVHYAHQHGVVHRDLKPANILLQESGIRGQESGVRNQGPGDRTGSCLLTPDACPKITDFGLAKDLDDPAGQTQPGDLVGTPSYMAPEQAGGRAGDVGPVTDVYALGAILYEMLTGRPPFKGETSAETLYQVLHADVVPPSRLRPQTPRDLETICLKCLDRDGRRRYGSAAALADDLDRFLDGRPILARRIGPWRRAVKWGRRRPAVAALFAVSAAAALIVGLLVWRHEASERRRREEARTEARTALDRGRSAFLRGDWNESRAQLDRALAHIAAESELSDLRPEVEELRGEADRRLNAQQQKARDDALLRQFVRWREDALFHGMNTLAQGTLLTGMDPAVHRREAEHAAREALALAKFPLEEAAWEPDRCFRDPAQRADVTASCYTLLIVLADVVAERAGPDAERAADLREAERLLRRASSLRPPTRALGLRLARLRQRLGDVEEARAETERAAGLPIVGALDYFLVGTDHARRREFHEAVRAFENAVGLQADHFWAQCYLGSCYLFLRQWEKAAACLTVCLVERPDFVWPHLLRGYAHCRLETFAAAEADFRHAERLLDHSPNEAARYALSVNRGLLRVRQGRSEEAAAEFRRAAALMPDSYVPHVNLARVLREQGKAEESARELERALRLEPPPLVLADYHAERGADLCREKKHGEAAAVCRKALSYQPDYAFAHGVLAHALLELGRYPEAAEEFNAYLKAGGRPVADVYRGRGLARMRQGDYLGARDDYTRVLEAEPGAEIYRHRGWAYFFADAWRPALRDFAEAVRLDPKDADAYAGRGLSHVMLSQYREAIADAEASLRFRPTTPETMHNLACLYAQAVDRIAADARASDRTALTDRCRTSAVRAIRQTLAMVRPEDRKAFWRDKILPDRALDPIRDSTEFRELQREQAAGPGKETGRRGEFGTDFVRPPIHLR